jgi:hypothetical protein
VSKIENRSRLSETLLALISNHDCHPNPHIPHRTGSEWIAVLAKAAWSYQSAHLASALRLIGHNEKTLT